MIAGLKPYPVMKDSGVEWLGEVPEHWQVLRIKTLFSEIDDRTKTGLENLLSLRMEQGLVPHTAVSSQPVSAGDLIGYKRVAPGHIVMNRMRAAIGIFGVPAQEGLVSPDYAIFRPSTDLELRYYLRLFKTPAMCSEFRLASKGLGTGSSGFMRLYTDQFGVIPVPSPSLAEQTAIVRYLDHVDRRVRRLVRAKRRLIVLLTEQKQAIIHRTVTRGLDPDVPLKDSGVEWLGEVPANWQVARLRNVTKLITSGSRGWSSFAADDGPLFLRVANLSRMSLDLRFHNVVRLNLPETSETLRTRVQSGDILLSITAYIGSVAVVPEGLGEAYVSQHVARCALQNNAHNPRWLGYVLLSAVGQTHGKLSLYGGTKDGLSLNDVKSYPLLLPPRGQQDHLVSLIERRIAEIDSVIGNATTEINLLTEYRTRLTADVVTGKLDLREAAAALPEVDPLAADDGPDTLDAESETDPEELKAIAEEDEA